MKINNISPQINFKQSIQINTSTDEYYNSHRYGEANKDLINVLNNKKNGYSKDEAKQIKEFFKDVLGKDNKNVNLVYYAGEKFLTTGNQTKDLNEIKAFTKKVKGIFTPELKSWFGGITRATHPSRPLQTLKETTGEWQWEMIKCICKYSDTKNRNTSLKITKNLQEERFTYFELRKQGVDGKIETKSLDLNA